MTWNIVLKGGYAHILPVDDLDEHDLDVRCACRPEVDSETTICDEHDIVTVVTHNSYDKRELNEHNYEPPKRNVQ